MTNNINLIPDMLHRMAVAPQGLDNQYVPRHLLEKNIPLINLHNDLKDKVRAEYIRSLLYSEQVVLNRAYIYNSPIIYEDFLMDSDFRDTFIRFLHKKWIIPWLYSEKTFEEKPAFSVDPIGWKAIKELKKDADIPYLRLSWDEDENIKKVNSLSKVYTGYVMRMVLVANQIANSLEIFNQDKRKKFIQKLNDIGRYCYDVFSKENRNFITRNDLYKKFVCVDDTPTSEGYYDPNKPFSYELKILFDLKYNVNLPDILNIQTLTGYGLPDRSALHEIDLLLASENREGVVLDLSQLFSHTILGKLDQVKWISSINRLNLNDIEKARRMEEYKIYINETKRLKKIAKDAINNLKVEPLDFNAYFVAFNNFQKSIAKSLESRIREEIQPSIEIIINIGGVILNILPTNLLVRILGIVDSVDKYVASFTASMIAKGRTAIELHNSSVGQDILNTTLANPQGELRKLIENLEKEGYEVKSKETNDKDEEGSIEDPMKDYWIIDY